MSRKGLILAAMVSAAGMSACGLDGVAGKLARIDGEWYHIVTMDGEELKAHVDHRTRKDAVSVGDRIHMYVSPTGHVEFLQKLD